MAQRHEVVAWLGGQWDGQQTTKMVDRILDSGSDLESDWMRVVAEVEQDEDLTGEVLAAASRDYDRAAKQMGAARAQLYAAIREAVAGGMTKYRAAQVTRLSEAMVGRIVRKGTP